MADDPKKRMDEIAALFQGKPEHEPVPNEGKLLTRLANLEGEMREMQGLRGTVAKQASQIQEIRQSLPELVAQAIQKQQSERERLFDVYGAHATKALHELNITADRLGLDLRARLNATFKPKAEPKAEPKKKSATKKRTPRGRHGAQ